MHLLKVCGNIPDMFNNLKGGQQVGALGNNGKSHYVGAQKTAIGIFSCAVRYRVLIQFDAKDTLGAGS